MYYWTVSGYIFTLSKKVTDYMFVNIIANEATKPTMLSVVGTKYGDSYNNVF